MKMSGDRGRWRHTTNSLLQDRIHPHCSVLLSPHHLPRLGVSTTGVSRCPHTTSPLECLHHWSVSPTGVSPPLECLHHWSVSLSPLECLHHWSISLSPHHLPHHHHHGPHPPSLQCLVVPTSPPPLGCLHHWSVSLSPHHLPT